MREQRNFHRLSTTGKVTFEGKDSFDSAVINISYGGIAVYSKEKLDVGKQIAFNLKVGLSYESIKCSGIIRHITERDSSGSVIYKMGIEFIDVNKDSIVFVIKRIQSVIADLQRSKRNVKKLDFIPY